MNILLITNDWKPKTGGISTYLRSLVENLDHKFFIYGPSWIEGDDAYPAADTFIINPRKVFEDIQKIVNVRKVKKTKGGKGTYATTEYTTTRIHT